MLSLSLLLIIQGWTETVRLQTGISSLFLGTVCFLPPYLIFPTIFVQVACPIISQDHKVKSFSERETVLGETHANGCTLRSLEVGPCLRLLWRSARLFSYRSCDLASQMVSCCYTMRCSTSVYWGKENLNGCRKLELSADAQALNLWCHKYSWVGGWIPVHCRAAAEFSSVNWLH